jgi:hypothetical protein
MSIFDQISQPISSVIEQAETRPTPKATAPVKSDPYFYKQFPSGATIGRADERDTSGRPFFAYRNPGDEATTTDKTRIAPTFDPTVRQPLTKEQYYNPRTAGLREKFNKEFGIKPSEELDHEIALAVGGSNDPENLSPLPKAENRKGGTFEAQLARDLVAGKRSYLEAQLADAELKGNKPPWEPAVVYVESDKDKTLVENEKALLVKPHQSLMDRLFNGDKLEYYKKSPEETGRFLQSKGMAQPGEFTMYNPDPKQTDDSPTIMASGKKIYDGAIATSDYSMPLGTKVFIPELNRVFVVEDRMNRRYSPDKYGKVVFDIPTTTNSGKSLADARGFGRQQLRYVIIGHDGRIETKAEN